VPAHGPIFFCWRSLPVLFHGGNFVFDPFGRTAGVGPPSLFVCFGAVCPAVPAANRVWHSEGLTPGAGVKLSARRGGSLNSPKIGAAAWDFAWRGGAKRISFASGVGPNWTAGVRIAVNANGR